MRHDLQGSLVKDKGGRSSLKVKYGKLAGLSNTLKSSVLDESSYKMDQSRDEMSRNIGQNGPTMDRKDVNGPIRGEDLSGGIDYFCF